MFQANAQPDLSGSFSTENAPQGVLRAGQTLACLACGTMVEVPAQVVGRKVILVDHSRRDEPDGSAVAQEVPGWTESPQAGDSQAEPSRPGLLASDVSPRHCDGGEGASAGTTQAELVSGEASPGVAISPETPPLRTKRRKQPSQVGPQRRRIDGLQVPAADEMERAFAWVSFHLKLLGLQGSQMKRLQKVLKRRQRQARLVPETLHASEDQSGSMVKKKPMPMLKPVGQPVRTGRSHAHVDVSMTPDRTRREAEGHAPADASIPSAKVAPGAKIARERGPP
ncbi:hypothetical protein [Bremerella alba]|nr:hypothetical protein [Bremerella alba]